MKRTESKSRIQRMSGVLTLAVVVALRTSAAAQGQPTSSVPESTRVQRNVLVSIPDRKLAVLEDGKVIRTFPVAVGAVVSPSPVGKFEIINRITNPTYYHEGVVVPPGANNPVGPRWVGLSQKGYGIHGTNAPRSIGKAASHGCIRLNNNDIKEFFLLVEVGDTVEIRAERDEQIAQIFGGTNGTELTTIAQAQTTMSPAGGGQ